MYRKSYLTDFATPRDRRRTVFQWGILAGLILTVLLTAVFARYNTLCDAVCGDTLRLHILANSDTVEDQLLKLKVRDAVLEQIGPMLQGVENKQQAIDRLRGALPALQLIAQSTVHANRSAEPVNIRLETMQFDTRDYGSFALPAGEYTALRIELGSAQGHNWFCVLYPELCIGSSEADYGSTAENALVFGRYEIRFAALDAARGLWRSAQGETSR